MAAKPILFLPEAIKGTISAASYSQPIYSSSHILSRSETNMRCLWWKWNTYFLPQLVLRARLLLTSIILSGIILFLIPTYPRHQSHHFFSIRLIFSSKRTVGNAMRDLQACKWKFFLKIPIWEIKSTSFSEIISLFKFAKLGKFEIKIANLCQWIRESLAD